jgi:hypothetical protein
MISFWFRSEVVLSEYGTAALYFAVLPVSRYVRSN